MEALRLSLHMHVSLIFRDCRSYFSATKTIKKTNTMPKLLFNMHGAPDDEIQDIRELCEKHNLPVYETEIGRWRIGLAAIWLREEEKYEEAKAILDEYQKQRYENAQEDRKKMQSLNWAEGLYVKFKQDPNQFFLTLIALVIILGLTLYPFLNL